MEIRAAFEARRNLLVELADKLDARMREALEGLPHVDRISFRPKSTDSFVAKVLDSAGRPVRAPDGVQKYVEPLEEVEDQVAGRILVFFRRDIAVVEAQLREWFRASVEYRRRAPASAAAFGYESDHFIFVIDEHMKPAGWDGAGPMPLTFELQVRTLFMHAYAEPQHDLGYKPGQPLDSDTEREFAWIAASAWGADKVMNELYERLASR